MTYNLLKSHKANAICPDSLLVGIDFVSNGHKYSAISTGPRAKCLTRN